MAKLQHSSCWGPEAKEQGRDQTARPRAAMPPAPARVLRVLCVPPAPTHQLLLQPHVLLRLLLLLLLQLLLCSAQRTAHSAQRVQTTDEPCD